MLASAQANPNTTKIMVLKSCRGPAVPMLKWRSRDRYGMPTSRLWRRAIPKAIVVDASTYVGQYRPTGDSGNLRDIITAYNVGGVDFTGAGYGQIALALANALK